MYRVLLVDDEPWITIGLRKLIAWNELGYDVAGEVHNGIDAWTMIEKLKPQVVISDIRMPGFDGLELLEKIKTVELPVKVILISGYADFAYAQKAVRLGAFDYLLKQIDREQLTETLKHLYEKMVSEDNIKMLGIRTEDLYDILNPNQRVTVKNLLDKKNLRRDESENNINAMKYCVIVSVYTKEEIKSRQMEDIIRIPEIAEKAVYYVQTGRYSIVTVLFFKNEPEDDAFDIMFNMLMEDGNVAGISSVGKIDSILYRLFDEAEIAIQSERMFPTNGIRRYSSYSSMAGIMGKVRDLEIAAKKHNKEQIIIWVREIQRICEEGSVLIDELAFVYGQIVNLYNRYYLPRDREALDCLNFNMLAVEYPNQEALFETLNSLFNQEPSLHYEVENKLVKKILEEVHDRYNEKLCIQDIAAKYAVSQGYLSSMVKQETGLTFTEHLTNRRIEKAREFLQQTDASILEIAERVGYADYFNFIKVFKKITGISPSQFRKI